jgi:hypothetical protein
MKMSREARVMWHGTKLAGRMTQSRILCRSSALPALIKLQNGTEYRVSRGTDYTMLSDYCEERGKRIPSRLGTEPTLVLERNGRRLHPNVIRLFKDAKEPWTLWNRNQTFPEAGADSYHPYSKPELGDLAAFIEEGPELLSKLAKLDGRKISPEKAERALVGLPLGMWWTLIQGKKEAKKAGK